jgi:CheY-like chemotaxis protein
MGGDVGFESHPGEASRFWVEVPVGEAAPAPEKSLAHASVQASNGAPVGLRRVLYVEDNAANVAFMRDLVGTFPETDLVTVPMAEQALEVARQRRPDLIVMDINLPGMSGSDALRLLRADPETASIPVIALTAAARARPATRAPRRVLPISHQASECRRLHSSVRVPLRKRCFGGLSGAPRRRQQVPPRAVIPIGVARIFYARARAADAVPDAGGAPFAPLR